MLLKKFKFGVETVAARSGAGKCTLAVIACASLLVGCATVSDVGDGIGRTYSKVEAGIRQQYNETFNSPDESENSETASSSDAGKADAKMVTLSRSGVKRLQTRLAKLGYPSGPADGVLGMKTVKAIKKKQKAHKLPVTVRSPQNS